jgi:hypothetical protein
MVTEMCLLRDTIMRVMVNRSNGILNGFWYVTVSGILHVSVNLVTYGKTLLCVFISVHFPVGSIYFIRMLVKFLHNRPAMFTLEKAMKAQMGSRDIPVLFL